MLYRAEKPSLATAMSVWKDRERIPVDDWISGGTLVPQYRPITGPTVNQSRLIRSANSLSSSIFFPFDLWRTALALLVTWQDHTHLSIKLSYFYESLHLLTFFYIDINAQLLALLPLTSIISIAPSSADIWWSHHLLMSSPLFPSSLLSSIHTHTVCVCVCVFVCDLSDSSTVFFSNTTTCICQQKQMSVI